MEQKRKVNPYVPQYIRGHVHEVARFLRQSEGETGAQLVMAALNDFPTLNRLAPYMWRGYAYGTHAWIGHREHKDVGRFINPPGHIAERLSMRFSMDDWASVDALGFAFGRPVAHAAAALLRMAYDFPRVTQIVAPGFVPRSPYAMPEVGKTWDGGLTS